MLPKDQPKELAKLLGFSLVGAVAIAGLGYFLGPPKKPAKGRKADAAALAEELQEDEMSPGLDASEQQFQILYKQLEEAIARNDFVLAEKRADALLHFAKVFGEQSINYGFILGIPIASFYEAKKDFQKMEKCLREAIDILRPFGLEYVLDTGILEKLVNLYIGNSEYSKAEKYALLHANTRKSQLKEKPSPDMVEKFGQAANKAGLILSNLGNFKQAQAQFKEALKVYQEATSTSPSAFQCLEYYSNMLHQQGKTREAVAELNAYREKTILQNDPKKIRTMIIRRAATLLFTIDEYAESAKYLKMILNEQMDKNLEILVLAELANCYWELNNKTEANKIQSEIKIMVPLNQFPYTRSKYLSTIEGSLEPRSGYKLLMRVNRDQPNRKQGEPLEEAQLMKRKLEKCFLEISFEIQSGHFVKNTFQVNTPHEFEISSPPSDVVFESAKWYEVKIDIYKDKEAYNNKSPIGTHHQLMFVRPTQFFFK